VLLSLSEELHNEEVGKQIDVFRDNPYRDRVCSVYSGFVLRKVSYFLQKIPDVFYGHARFYGKVH